MRKLNKKLKRKWCAALRGGAWEQITGQLKGPSNLRCALGVLAEVAGISLEREDDAYNELCKIAGDYTLGGLAHIWRRSDGNCIYGIQPHSFSEMADWIEENL